MGGWVGYVYIRIFIKLGYDNENTFRLPNCNGPRAIGVLTRTYWTEEGKPLITTCPRVLRLVVRLYQTGSKSECLRKQELIEQSLRIPPPPAAAQKCVKNTVK